MQRLFLDDPGRSCRCLSESRAPHKLGSTLNAIKLASLQLPARGPPSAPAGRSVHCNAGSTLTADPSVASNGNAAQTFGQYEALTPEETYSKASIKVTFLHFLTCIENYQMRELTCLKPLNVSRKH